MAKSKIGSRPAGTGLSVGHITKTESSYEELFTSLRTELDDIRAKNALLLAKLDGEAQVANDYVSTLTLADSTFEA